MDDQIAKVNAISERLFNANAAYPNTPVGLRAFHEAQQTYDLHSREDIEWLIHELDRACGDLERLRAVKEPGIVCYWDTNDTEVGEAEISEVLDRHSHGVVVGVDHVAVLRTTWHVTLPAAEDADSDDIWEVEAGTEEEAQAALDVEKSRRKALAEASEKSTSSEAKEPTNG